MLAIICGGIGSGKTTFAYNQFQYVTDFDEIGSKRKQIKATLDLLRQGKTVAHITTFPSRYEIENLIQKVDPRLIQYYWLDTTIEQCLENVRARGRARDLQRLDEILKINTELEFKRRGVNINWLMVKYTPPLSADENGGNRP